MENLKKILPDFISLVEYPQGRSYPGIETWTNAHHECVRLALSIQDKIENFR